MIVIGSLSIFFTILCLMMHGLLLLKPQLSRWYLGIVSLLGPLLWGIGTIAWFATCNFGDIDSVKSYEYRNRRHSYESDSPDSPSLKSGGLLVIFNSVAGIFVFVFSVLVLFRSIRAREAI
jgi:hypothetical protein